MQLSEEASLEEAQEALARAIKLDDTYIDAFIELGWFRLNVLDSPKEAAEAFEQARVIIQQLIGELFQGLLACNAELYPNQNNKHFEKEFRKSLLPILHESNDD